MKKILVVDDSYEARTLLKLILEEHFDLFFAVSGESAFQMISEMKIDLVISDLEMPQGGGEWLLKSLQMLQDPPKIIILSGNISVCEDELIQKGALAFFRKPVSFDYLMNFVSSIL